MGIITMQNITVCALYKFVRLENFEQLKSPLLSVMLENEIKGTLLLANEGINGTVAGTKASIDLLLAHLETDERLINVSHKYSYADENPFQRSKVKLKKEIVTMGVEGIDP